MRKQLALFCLALAAPAAAKEMGELAKLHEMAAQFAPVDLKVDVGALPPSERTALARLVEAARVLDALFLRQAWAGNETLLLQLQSDQSPLGRARLHAFLLNKGPWDRLDHDAPFLPGVGAKPPQANFYPAHSTKEEVERWLHALPESGRADASGFFTTIRRATDGRFTVIPYSVEYQGELAHAADLLRAAAAATEQPSLKTFLEKRAQAFLSNDYRESDLAWMQLDSSIEPTIGPYEVYEDGWFNAKAAFEAFIAVRDDAETRKLTRFSSELQEIEDHLPIDPALRNPKIGALAPIRVVNQIYCSGDANHGVQTAAFNLPNDERTTREHGTKRVMLKNVQEAKFNKVLIPIAKIALPAAARKEVAFDAFFTHILMHELAHGLGPHAITVGGRATTVRQSLEDTYSAIEEAKADVLGLFAMQYLIDKGRLPKEMERTMYATFLASAFRSIRFGLNEAHGRGMALQINSLIDAGAVVRGADGSFAIAPAKARAAVEGLARELLTVEAHGDRAAAEKLLGERAVLRPEVKAVLDRLGAIAVDIEPRFVTAEQLLK